MKILQVVHQFFPEHLGGTETYTYNLCKELQAGNEVFIFCREYGKEDYPIFVEDSDLDGLRVRKIYYNKPCGRLKSFINEDFEKLFKEYLNITKPDVVHFQHLYGLSASLISIARKQGLPVVITLHDYWYICPRIQMIHRDLTPCMGPESGLRCMSCDNFLLGWNVNDFLREHFAASIKSVLKQPFLLKALKRVTPAGIVNHAKNYFGKSKSSDTQLLWIYLRFHYMQNLLNSVEALISPSHFLKKAYENAGVRSQNFILSDNGTKVENFLNVSKEPSDMIRFAYFSTLVNHKGAHVLIRAFNKVTEPNAMLKLYGTSMYSPLYASRIKNMASNPRIQFMGSTKSVADDFRSTDVVIVPSIWPENSPVIIHEASVAKIPVIASNVGGIPEFVKDGETGLLFEAGNSEDLLDKLNRIIRNPSLLTFFARNTNVKTIQQNCAEILELYEDLIRAKGK